MEQNQSKNYNLKLRQVFEDITINDLNSTNVDIAQQCLIDFIDNHSGDSIYIYPLLILLKTCENLPIILMHLIKEAELKLLRLYFFDDTFTNDRCDCDGIQPVQNIGSKKLNQSSSNDLKSQLFVSEKNLRPPVGETGHVKIRRIESGTTHEYTAVIDHDGNVLEIIDHYIVQEAGGMDFTSAQALDESTLSKLKEKYLGTSSSQEEDKNVLTENDL